MFRLYAAAPLLLAMTVSAHADPCADVTRAQNVLASGFANVETRKDGSLEYLKFPLFGDDACTIARPWAASSRRRITCMLADYGGDDKEMEAFARARFDGIAKTLRSCLKKHDPFDNRANEDPDDEIVDRLHYRSHDGRETWALTAEDATVPSAVLNVEFETDAAEAQKHAKLPEYIQNVLASQACDLFEKMAALARSNFEGVETKRVRTEWAMTKPVGGAGECLVARDRMRNENIIACTWKNETADHAGWAQRQQAIRLNATKQCRKGWTETQKRFETEFSNSSGDKLSVGTASADTYSVTGVSVVVKTRP